MSQAPKELARHVLAYIEKQSQAQGDTEFLRFVERQDLPSRQRLGFALCVTPLAMGLSDWFIHALRYYPDADPQKPIPERALKLRHALHAHTIVDENHWEWFLGDLEILGFDKSMRLSDVLRLFWGEHMLHSRLIIYRLIALVRNASPIMRLVALETFEEGAAVAFKLFRDAGEQICRAEGRPALSYFGMAHKEQEDQHSANNIPSIPSLIEGYDWTAAEVEEAKTYVDEVSAYYTNLGKELHAYAQKAVQHRDEKIDEKRWGDAFWPLQPKELEASAQRRQKRLDAGDDLAKDFRAYAEWVKKHGGGAF